MAEGRRLDDPEFPAWAEQVSEMPAHSARSVLWSLRVLGDLSMPPAQLDLKWGRAKSGVFAVPCPPAG